MDGDHKGGIVAPFAAVIITKLRVEGEEAVDVSTTARGVAQPALAERPVGRHIKGDEQLIAGAVDEVAVVGVLCAEGGDCRRAHGPRRAADGHGRLLKKLLVVVIEGAVLCTRSRRPAVRVARAEHAAAWLEALVAELIDYRAQSAGALELAGLALVRRRQTKARKHGRLRRCE